MKYLSICSGIEAATQAWHPLGWEPLAFSEIDAFPRAVLAHHYPAVPLHGDFTALKNEQWIADADVLVGGTPCQAFSVAGLRNSLADERGNLSLEFVRLADAIDNFRLFDKRPPCVIVWENVPGVLSVKDNAFGCFLAALAGDDTPYIPPRGKWTNAGVVAGPQRTIAWIIKDAQYFGVAQRRRRLFVVASAGEKFDPAAVLLECEGVRRDTAPRRGTEQEASADAAIGFRSRSHWDGDFPHPTLNQSARATGGVGSSNQELFSQRGAYLAPVITMAHGQGGAEIAFDRSPTLTCNHEAPIMSAIAFHHNAQACQLPGEGRDTGISDALTCSQQAAVAFDSYNQAVTGDITKTLDVGQDYHHVPNLIQNMQVRRLTPIECERLQGFPDTYTQIPWRNKPAEGCPDGPRYKALGNSMAVPVMHWIGQRIQNAVSSHASLLAK